MSISEAIARVRRGATRSRASLLDGALSYLGVRFKADLATRLKSNSVPPPLRPLATRLASLIKLSDSPPYDDAAKQQLEVVALDRALMRAAQQRAPQAETTHAVHPAGDVCPFTGLRADGSLAEAPATPASPPANAQAPASTLVVDNLAGTTRLPIPTAANDASSVVPTDIAGNGDNAAVPGAADEAAAHAGTAARPDPRAPTPKKSSSKRGAGQPGAKPPSEKRKEKLAAPQDLTNTSARSATRPANKQPSGKGQTSSRKRRDSGL